MNKIFRVIWNDSLKLFQVANEITKAHGKSSSSVEKKTSAQNVGGGETTSRLNPTANSPI